MMTRYREAAWLLALMVLGAGGLEGWAAPATFTNPIVASGADPWVIQWQRQYYLCQSHGRGMWVGKSERLEDLGQGAWASVWTPPEGTNYSKEIWAPELHRLRGRWFIYFAADDGDNFHHRMYVLEGSSQDPQASFVFRGKLALPGDRWAIDGTVLQVRERLYFVWSGWEADENVAQNLYIAAMTDPLTVTGDRVCISRPEQKWERQGDPWVNEGPEALWHEGKLFLIYSASGSWGDDYCLGQLAWTGGDPLTAASWVKKPEPVFSRTADVFGPGHCSFTKSPDGREDWIVYHAAKFSGAGWNRNIRMQRFTWNADGSPSFGRPVSVGVPLAVPGGSAPGAAVAEPRGGTDSHETKRTQ